MSKKFLGIVGVLACAGVGLAAWADQGPRMRRGWHPDLGRLRAELGLTDAQVTQLEKLHSDRQKQQIRRRADMQIARVELRDLLAPATVDEKAVGAKVKELGDLQAAALKARVDGQLALRKILTPEQHEKLKQLRMRVIRERRPQGPGPMRGRPGEGPRRPDALDEDGPGEDPDEEAPEPPRP